MAEFALHVLKLNIISAVVIFLVLGLSVLLKNRFTARWKYVVEPMVRGRHSALPSICLP